MSYLLDTNVISELRKSSERINPEVRNWAAQHDVETMFLSALSVFEIELGIERKQRVHAEQAMRLRDWFDGVVQPMFAGRILPLTDRVAAVAARMNVPDPRPLADCFIAATAIVNGMTVVTRNVSDLDDLGVAVINPWQL